LGVLPWCGFSATRHRSSGWLARRYGFGFLLPRQSRAPDFRHACNLLIRKSDQNVLHRSVELPVASRQWRPPGPARRTRELDFSAEAAEVSDRIGPAATVHQCRSQYRLSENRLQPRLCRLVRSAYRPRCSSPTRTHTCPRVRSSPSKPRRRPARAAPSSCPCPTGAPSRRGPNPCR